jgi:mRNA interferase MazF
MEIKQFDIWIADLNPKIGTEPGKKRPVVILQTNLLNKIPHPSTIICPLTTNIQQEAAILRIHLQKGEAGLFESCDIMTDQMRAIDNRRLANRAGRLSPANIEMLKENIKIVLDLD